MDDFTISDAFGISRLSSQAAQLLRVKKLGRHKNLAKGRGGEGKKGCQKSAETEKERKRPQKRHKRTAKKVQKDAKKARKKGAVKRRKK